MRAGATGRTNITVNFKSNVHARQVFPATPLFFFETVDELKLEQCVHARKVVHSSSARMELKDAAVMAHDGVNLCKHKLHVLDDTDVFVDYRASIKPKPEVIFVLRSGKLSSTSSSTSFLV